MKRLYPGVVNSPYTTTTAPIDEDDTTIPVGELWVFPPGKNLAVLGAGNDAETVEYTSKSGDSGAGTLLGVTREIQGTAKAWDTGTKISRRLTAYDIDSLRENLNDVTVLEGQAGEALSQFETVYLADDGKWYKTDATEFESSWGQIGIAIDAIGSGATGRVQVAGKVTNPGWSLTPARSIYLSDTPGAIDHTPGTIQRMAGVALTSTSFLISPRFVCSPINAGISVLNQRLNPIVVNTPVYFFVIYESVYSITSYDWDFGDESSHSAQPAPTHTYLSEGTYEVTLTLTDSVGNKGIAKYTVNVYERDSTLLQGRALFDEQVKALTSHEVTLTSNNFADLPCTGEEVKALTSHEVTLTSNNFADLPCTGEEVKALTSHEVSISNS